MMLSKSYDISSLFNISYLLSSNFPKPFELIIIKFTVSKSFVSDALDTFSSSNPIKTAQ